MSKYLLTFGQVCVSLDLSFTLLLAGSVCVNSSLVRPGYPAFTDENKVSRK